MYKKIYHTTSEFLPSTDLPLSWTNSAEEEEISIIKIGRKNVWLNGGNFNDIDNFITSIEKFSKNKKIVIRGCNKKTTQKLKKIGFNETLFAKEAIIELNKEIPITQKLLRRINSLLKRGQVKEISNSKKNDILFDSFLGTTVHSGKPQLKNLFLDKLNQNTRLFIFEIIPNQWEGAILISKNSHSKMQGEQFFRKKNGMNGVMDTLVFQIGHILNNEGYAEFSLGEVPFIVKDELSSFSKTNLLHVIGKRIKFAYNYEGLHHFKNKFAARWDDIFICTNGKLKLYDIYRMAKKSNLLALTIYKIFN